MDTTRAAGAAAKKSFQQHRVFSNSFHPIRKISIRGMTHTVYYSISIFSLLSRRGRYCPFKIYKFSTTMRLEREIENGERVTQDWALGQPLMLYQ